MNDTVKDSSAALSGLRIDRAQRPDERRRGRTPLVIMCVIVVLAAAGGAWWYWTTTGVQIAAALAGPVVDVKLLEVSVPTAASSNPISLVATGKIVSDRRINVATKVSGQIVEMMVEQGDKVEQDQVLARIEDVVYRAQRDEASANVARQRYEHDRAKSEHARAVAAIDQARAIREFEERNFERLDGLFRAKQASENERLDAKNRYEAAAAAVAVAEAAAESAKIAIDTAQAQLRAVEAAERSTQKRLDDCAIRAPIGGVVLERNAQVGDFLAAEGGRGANANAQLVAIADMSLLRVEIDVSERDIHRVRPNQPTRITPDADRSRVYDGRVMWVDPVGDYARATVQVKVRVRDPGPNLRISGSAKVEFLGESTSVAQEDTPVPYWIPKDAVKLLPDDAGAVVFTVRDDRAIATPIEIGVRSGDLFEVLSGLGAGMRIIADNADDLTDDTRVRIIGP